MTHRQRMFWTWLQMAALLPVALAGREVPFAAAVDLDFLPNGRGVLAGDIDRDGDLDLVAWARGAVVWYEREVGAFDDYTRRTANSYPAGSHLGTMRLADLDGDGDLDVVTTRRDDDGESVFAEWLENDAPAAGEWSRHRIREWTSGVLIDLVRTNGLAVADFDGDGDLDVAASRFERDVFLDGDGRIEWLESDGTPADGGWSAHLLEDWRTEEDFRSFTAIDLDRDGDPDLVCEAQNTDGVSSDLLWYENDGSPQVGQWPRHAVDLSVGLLGTDGLQVGDLDRDGDADLVANADDLDWYENDGTPLAGWVRHGIGDQPSTRALDLVDLNRDGTLDAVVGNVWFENDGSPGNGLWDEHALTVSVSERRAFADLDGDGDLDIASVAFDEEIELAEDLELHRSARYPSASSVAAGIDEAFDLIAADLDGDGDLDLVSASEAGDRLVFHRNDGTPVDGGWINLDAILGVNGARALAAGDLDGDGDLDLVSAAYNDDTVAWHESDGSPQNGGWVTRDVSAGAGGASDVTLADLDGDGDLDIACAQYLDDEISWYRNNGGSPPTFTAFFVDDAAYLSPRALVAADFDGDGDLDLATTSEGTHIAWYANDGTPASGEWSRAAVALNHGGKDLLAVDLDRDGDVDLVATDYDSDAVRWYENNNGASSWTAHNLLLNCNGARSVAAGDLDLDGDPDVLASCYLADSIWLLKSDGAATPSFAAEPVGDAANGGRTLVAADLDRDGDLDVAAALGSADEIVWHSNRGGQFALEPFPTAPARLYSDEEQDLFRVTVRHRGRAGDGDLSLVTFRLYFEEAPGDPLTEAQFDALVFAVSVYRDTGNLVFDPALDTLVHAEVQPDLGFPGRYTFDFIDGAALSSVAFGQPRTYFVVVLPRNPFGVGAPPAFEVTFLTQGASFAICSAEDRDFDIPIDLEWAPVLTTVLIDPVALVFRDSFENGNIGRWSRHWPL